jgi:hypothetical protein
MRDRGAVFPVVLYLDNHSSHISLRISEECRKLDVILITLPANSTWLSQPCDALYNAVLKRLFAELLEAERREKPLFVSNRNNFSKFLKLAVIEAGKRDNLIQRCFERCGISWPLNPDAIDYTKLKTNPISSCAVQDFGPPTKEEKLWGDKVLLEEVNNTNLFYADRTFNNSRISNENEANGKFINC